MFITKRLSCGWAQFSCRPWPPETVAKPLSTKIVRLLHSLGTVRLVRLKYWIQFQGKTDYSLVCLRIKISQFAEMYSKHKFLNLLPSWRSFYKFRIKTTQTVFCFFLNRFYIIPLGRIGEFFSLVLPGIAYRRKKNRSDERDKTHFVMSSLQQGLKELKIKNFALKKGKVQLKNYAANRHKKHLFFQKVSKGFASTLFTNQCNESVAISMVKFSS